MKVKKPVFPGFTRALKEEEMGERIAFPYILWCYSSDKVLRWSLPLPTFKAVKLMRLLWKQKAGNYCTLSKGCLYVGREAWLPQVKFYRNGKLYLSTYFSNSCLPGIWMFLWAVRGGVKAQQYTAEEVLRPHEVKYYSRLECTDYKVPLLRMSHGDLEGYPLSKKEARLAMKLKHAKERMPF